MTRLAVAVSPHLDDAAFSVGGLLARLVDDGWRVRVVTCLTASVPDPTGFALSCQTDKGLAPDVDYLALRRAEDQVAMAALGVRDVVHLPLPEAPHRGYESAAALFAGVREDDDLGPSLRAAVTPHLVGADLVLAPQGLGGHVDHALVVAAVAELVAGPASAAPRRAPGGLAAGPSPESAPAVGWWRDAPYVARDPAAVPAAALPSGLREQVVVVDAVLDRKIAACQAYASQLGFQFGGPAACAEAVTDLARAEARRTRGIGSTVGAAEVLLAGDRLPCADPA